MADKTKDVSTHAGPDAFNPVVFEIRRIREWTSRQQATRNFQVYAYQGPSYWFDIAVARRLRIKLTMAFAINMLAAKLHPLRFFSL